MKANELRIGNLLHSNLTNKEFHVTAEDIVNICLEPFNVKPIPLTEEWLMKFHAKRFPWGWVINEILIRTNNKYKFWIELGNGKKIDLPYVHTLQNFLALTGDELTPKHD